MLRALGSAALACALLTAAAGIVAAAILLLPDAQTRTAWQLLDLLAL